MLQMHTEPPEKRPLVPSRRQMMATIRFRGLFSLLLLLFLLHPAPSVSPVSEPATTCITVHALPPDPAAQTGAKGLRQVLFQGRNPEGDPFRKDPGRGRRGGLRDHHDAILFVAILPRTQQEGLGGPESGKGKIPVFLGRPERDPKARGIDRGRFCLFHATGKTVVVVVAAAAAARVAVDFGFVDHPVVHSIVDVQDVARPTDPTERVVVVAPPVLAGWWIRVALLASWIVPICRRTPPMQTVPVGSCFVVVEQLVSRQTSRSGVRAAARRPRAISVVVIAAAAGTTVVDRAEFPGCLPSVGIRRQPEIQRCFGVVVATTFAKTAVGAAEWILWWRWFVVVVPAKEPIVVAVVVAAAAVCAFSAVVPRGLPLPITTHNTPYPIVGTAHPGIGTGKIWESATPPPADQSHQNGTAPTAAVLVVVVVVVLPVIKQGTTAVSHAGISATLHGTSTQHCVLVNRPVVGLGPVADREWDLPEPPVLANEGVRGRGGRRRRRRCLRLDVVEGLRFVHGIHVSHA
mmetsp:Transcript_5310/g.12049  ORF Transcript_5310/g.12049 Transcript_5310/m.12049 type:complete len:518 (+) Transcript_5310:495-2048(+)